MSRVVKKEVALTFDDGPNPPYTLQILETLAKERVSATFFVCGANIAKSRRTLRRISGAGHPIGNHTFWHRPWFNTVSEIERTQSWIETATGQQSRIYRNPNLPTPRSLAAKLVERGFWIPPMGVMGFDWQKDLSEDAIALNIYNGVTGQSSKIISNAWWPEATLHRLLRWRRPEAFSPRIIILHDGSGVEQGVDRSRTVEAVKKIIPMLRSDGYEFVRLDKIVNGD